MPSNLVADILSARAYPDFPPGKRACSEPSIDPEIFYPDGYALGQAMPAIRICRKCDVQDACANWALETGQHFGVWGGLSPTQRRKIRRNGAGR